ncbi:MAG TPA: ribonuclease III [Prolixibacteraceae bacterium]|jgi:ribonuclease-3|nr:ribonuclease III [Bacteroidales bacterium]HNZ71661.1 ribonuclease III [Prolixibacteraceae bacterium]HQN93612.1 ribonuclease III [Prolixibacteraceae bacterium]HUM88582.1 ribonuclease III [Prolixibacteraceae bacterium]
MIRTIFQRIKLFSSPRKEFYLFLKDILGFYPGNLKLYDIAFVHKSASMTDSMGNLINNERLEYLGDAILGAVVAEFLYRRFPQRGEGFLTQMRSKLVNRAFLTQLINETGMHRFIKSRTVSPLTACNIYGDALEALIGAIYLDKGYQKARYVIVKRFLDGYVDLNKMEEQDNNYKSQLIEWGQKNKMEVTFQTDEEDSPNSKFSIFVTTVEIDNQLKGKGYGSSKKESQQNAAREALSTIEPD